MAVDSLWSSVTLLLPCSADLLDVKGHTVTVVGNTALSSAVGTPFGAGNACYFDGTGDYLRSARSLDTVALTIGMWVYVSSAVEQAFYAQFDIGAAGRLSLYLNSSGKLEFFIGSSPSNLLITDASTFTTGAWRYIEACRDSLGNAYLFNNGVLVATGSNSQVPYNGDCSVGGQWTPASGLQRPLTGYVAQVRVDNGTCRHTSGFSVPTAPFPRPTISGIVLNSSAAPVEKTILVVDRSSQRMLGGTTSSPSTGAYLFYPPDFGEYEVKRLDEVFDPPTHEAVFDLVCSGKPNGLIHADTLGSLVSWYGDAKLDSSGASARLDGSGDRIESSPPNLRLGTHDFSIDLYFLPVGGGGGSSYCRILAIGANDTDGSLYIVRNATDNPMTFLFETYSGGSYATILDYVATTVSNAWHKLQLRRTNGVLSAYVDGTLYATKACTVDFTGTTISVGGRVGGPEYFDCNIRAVRVSKGPIRGATTIPSATLLKMPTDGGSGENALIYDRVIPG